MDKQTRMHTKCYYYQELISAAKQRKETLVLTVVEFQNPNNTINGKLLITFTSF